MKKIDGHDIYSITEVNYFAKQTLEQMIFWVEGEISSIQKDPKWFNSFITIQDDANVLPCFMESSKFANYQDLKIGEKVLLYGILTLFKKNEYKLKIFKIEQSGEGVLKKKFEELYKKLKAEKLFDERYKKEIPLYPKKVCVVTSEGSAGWNDFKTHTVDKFPVIELYTANISVGGVNAIKQLTESLPKLDRYKFDVIVITRGGGAEETLTEVFNDEKVTRSVFNLKTPIIVAVGHEINITFAELASDKRASTPTDAANIVVNGYSTILDKLSNVHFRLKSEAGNIFSNNSQLLDSIYFKINAMKTIFKDLPFRIQLAGESLKKHEKNLIYDADLKIEDLFLKTKMGLKLFIESKTRMLQNLNKSLEILSPTNTFSRGYSIATDQNGRILRSIEGVVVGDKIGVELTDGKLTSKVVGKSQ